MHFLVNSLAGLTLARTGIEKAAPRGTLLLLLAINIPDVDYLAGLRGPLAQLQQHAGYTHSLLGLPLLAAVCVGLLSAAFREPLSSLREWAFAWLLACLGVACHLAGDGITAYGLRPMLPFSSHWYRADLCSQLDPWMLTLLGIALAWPHFSGLVSGEIGARITKGKRSAVFGLCLLAVFLSLRAFTHLQVIAQLNARLFDGAVPLRLAALPDIGNPFKWTAIVETQDRFHSFPVSNLEDLNAEAGQRFFKLPETPAILVAKNTEPFRYFLYFARFPVWTVEPVLLAQGLGNKVQLTDLSFGAPADNSLASLALETNASQLLRSWFTFQSADMTHP